MPDIVLTTLNARYIHSSFGLRYLFANLDELQGRAVIREFTISNRPIDIAEALLALKPKIIGLGVYIWNATETAALVALLKRIAPEIMIILGGPEVSYEVAEQPTTQLPDYVITGPGERSFYQLCQQLLGGMKPLNKVIEGVAVTLDQLQLPYDFYDEEDIRQRVVYVEASRGCPFKCEFCLSSLDKTSKPFELGRFLQEMARLYDRGLRHFKFVDRTFNLKVSTTVAILEFFLQRMAEDPAENDLFLHFELIPDHLPDALKAVIQGFPPGSLQFEIGIQTFDPEVQALISRKQDNEKSKANVRWLREHSHAHLHTDLIFGLPGEDVQSFADSFDQLVALQPHEIQLGILKRLRGSPIIRHTEAFKLVFNPHPPYDILTTDRVDFATMRQINRFARYWDMIGNSGRFSHTLPLLLGDSPFARFLRFTEALFKRTGQTHQIALKRLFDLVYVIAVEDLRLDPKQVQTLLMQDLQGSGVKGRLDFMQVDDEQQDAGSAITTQHRNRRQARHL